MNNQEKIESLAIEMLEQSFEAMKAKITKAVRSGAIDAESWDGKYLIPKAIVAAVLESESWQYLGRNTSFEKQVKKEVKNIQYFI